MEEQAALAALKLGWDVQQCAEASSTLDQWAPQTALLRGQLMVSEAERQRLQQELDALRRSHKALTSRYHKLRQQMEATLDQTTKNNMAAAAAVEATAEQLEVLQQQLDEANCVLDLQQVAIQQQAQELQQARDDLAAAAERCQAEQQQMKQQVADMAAAVAAADAARRRALQDEAAMLQAMAHLVQQQEKHQLKFQADKEQLKGELTAALEKASSNQTWADKLQDKVVSVLQKNKQLAEKTADALQEALHAECNMSKMQLEMRDMTARWDQYTSDTEQRVGFITARHQLECEEIKRQAAADQAVLAGQVAQLELLLERSNQTKGCEDLPVAADSTLRRRGLLRGGLQRLQNWVIR
jgi:chromosome segregation ATPase